MPLLYLEKSTFLHMKHVESESPEQPKSAEQPKSIELPILRQRDVDSWWAVTDSQLKALIENAKVCTEVTTEEYTC